MYEVSSDLGSSGSISLSMDAPAGNGSGSFVPSRAMSLSVSDVDPSFHESSFSPGLSFDLDSASVLLSQFVSSVSFDPTPLDRITDTFDLSIDTDHSSNSADSVDLGSTLGSEAVLDFDSFASFDFDSIAISVTDSNSGWLDDSVLSGISLEISNSDLDTTVLSPVGVTDASLLFEANLDGALSSGSSIDLGSSVLFSTDLASTVMSDLNTHSFGVMSLEIGIADQSVNSAATSSLVDSNHMTLDSFTPLNLDSGSESESTTI